MSRYIRPKELDPARTIVVATGNMHKLQEIEDILASLFDNLRFVALSQLGEFPEPEESGTTFFENALIKAQAAHDATGFAALADDSGLVVDALAGEPGVRSARWAGVHGDDAANNTKLLRCLDALPDDERGARFVSSVVFVSRTGCVLAGEGICKGRIGHAPQGEGGFGYDPLFWPDAASGKTMAELSPAEKNALSHRFYALQDLGNRLLNSGLL